jgi:deoxycytidylate deaminase
MLVPFTITTNRRETMATLHAEPNPCKRFAKRFVMNARFVAHLPCPECETAIAYLVNESNKLMREKREPDLS